MERPYEKLIAWQEAYQLFNIAEGNRKKSTKEKAHFLEIALCTLEELHCESKLSLDLEYITRKDFEDLDNRISRTSFLVYKLQQSIR
jgi:four helix bundle protein